MPLQDHFWAGPWDQGTPQLPVDVSVKPFPWPSVRFDVGAIAAAAAFNLLLVFAFLTPTRGAVATIVPREGAQAARGHAHPRPEGMLCL